jgi:hypothetical protein
MAYIIGKNGERLKAENCQCGYDGRLCIRKVRGVTYRLMCPKPRCLSRGYRVPISITAISFDEALKVWNREQETWKESDEIS